MTVVITTVKEISVACYTHPVVKTPEICSVILKHTLGIRLFFSACSSYNSICGDDSVSQSIMTFTSPWVITVLLSTMSSWFSFPYIKHHVVFVFGLRLITLSTASPRHDYVITNGNGSLL